MNMEYENLDMIFWMQEWNRSSLSDQRKLELLKCLFKYQLKKLESLQYDCIVHQGDHHIDGLDSRDIYRLAKMQKPVIEMAMKIGKPSFLPFLPVLPRKIVETFNVVMQLYNSGENWCPALNFNKVDMGKETSPHHGPYFILNIDQGWSTAGLSVEDSRAQITAKGLHAMNLAEAVADQMHTNILRLSAIYACGSTYKENKKYVPILYIDQQGNFGLNCDAIDKPKKGFISPSYETSMVAISWRGIINPKAWIRFKKRPKKERIIVPLKAD
ncbi:MAG: hypothetical protein WCK10_01300 [Candidatus Staskawiczbacteria bacterium]